MRIVSSAVAFALLASTSLAALPASATVQEPSALERFDSMNVTPMPEELAAAQRGESGLLLYYAAIYGVPASVALAAWASRWNPGASYWTAAKIVADFVKSLR